MPPYHDHSGGNELWLDYVSDLGDGFDATYSVAYLLGQPKLDVRMPAGTDTVPTPRGSLLVMGGVAMHKQPRRPTEHENAAPAKGGVPVA